MELSPLEKYQIHKVTVHKRILLEFLPHPLTPFINIDCFSLVFLQVWGKGYQIMPGLLMACCIFMELSPLEKYQIHKVTVHKRFYFSFGHAPDLIYQYRLSSLVLW